MSSALGNLIVEERMQRFSRLAGSRARISIPVRQPLVDRVLGGLHLPSFVRRLSVRLLPAARIHVHAELQVFGFSKGITAVLQAPPGLSPGQPRTLHLAFVERTLLSAVIGMARPLLGQLPRGVALDESGVTLDVEALAQGAGAADLLPHLRSMTTAGQGDVLWIEAEAEVQDGLERLPAPPVTRRAASSRAGTRLDRSELLGLLSGLRCEFSLRVAESIANALLGAAIADARDARGDAGSARQESTASVSVLEALGTPRVTFEPGAVVVEGTVVL
jgi:hypothetical protein